jgi:DMSO reductase family type II enzyme heme b subunit
MRKNRFVGPLFAPLRLCVRHFVVLFPVVVGCQQPPAPLVPNVIVTSMSSVPTDPGDPAWQGAPEYVAKLVPQDLVEPRQMSVSTPEIRIKALRSATEIAFHLAWNDATQDDLSDPGHFCDACAVQLPQKIGPTVPAPQMGEASHGIEIAYWNAGWQASVDGRGDSIQDIYPQATVDHYPFQAQSLEKDPAAQQAMALRYAPARALGNTMAGPRKTPVQDLIAAGPGTITPTQATTSKGQGRRTDSGWAVVIARRLPAGLLTSPNPQAAFAVWDGQRHEVGARKMRTGWLTMTIQEMP